MKIVPLAPSGTATYRNLVKWSRRLKISIFLQQYNINKIVLIGNGTPDDIVLMILLSKFNGKAFTDSLIGITKSGRLWIESILSGIDIVDKTHGKVKCLLIIIDQEKMSLRDIWMQIHEKISERASCSIVNDAKRLRVLNCSRGIYNFNFIITINGLDITQYCSHTIEDHLLEIAKDVSGAERISRLLAEKSDLRYAEASLKVEGIVEPLLGDAARVIREKLVGIADRVLMPLPGLSYEYLEYAILALRSGYPRYIHVYDFVRAGKNEDPEEKVRTKFTSKLSKLIPRFTIEYSRIVRMVGPRRYQVALDIVLERPKDYNLE